MDNQHKQIKGYRDLSQDEIDLMNEIKEHGEKTAFLLSKLTVLRFNNHRNLTGEVDEISLTQIQESERCLQLAKDNLQQGQMWFVRAVALPESF